MSLPFELSGQRTGASAFSNRPSNSYSGLISFRIDWFDLAVQGTFSSLFQHNSKASILWCSAFFMVQLLHPYMTTGKTIALTIWTFVSKVISLLFFFFFIFMSHSKFPLAIYFTYGDVGFHVTLSMHLTLSSPLPMSISLFSMCFSIAALSVNSSVLFF